MANPPSPQNKYILETEKVLAEKAREFSENGRERLIVSVSKMASIIDVPQSTLYNNHFPTWFEVNYDSARWKKHEGLIIDPIDDFIETYEDYSERREEKEKEKRKEKIRESTVNVGDIYE